jgi:hypothetical protein
MLVKMSSPEVQVAQVQQCHRLAGVDDVGRQVVLGGDAVVAAAGAHLHAVLASDVGELRHHAGRLAQQDDVLGLPNLARPAVALSDVDDALLEVLDAAVAERAVDGDAVVSDRAELDQHPPVA